MAVFAVDPARRVRCQCGSCKRTVYAKVHMIWWGERRFECWGRDCYRRELGSAAHGKSTKPIYPSVAGRELTPEERDLIDHNTQDLVDRFRGQFEREIEQKRGQAAERQGKQDAELAAFAAAIARRRAAALCADSGTPDPLLIEVVTELTAQWHKQHLDPKLPGWAGMFDGEVSREYESRRKTRHG